VAAFRAWADTAGLDVEREREVKVEVLRLRNFGARP